MIHELSTINHEPKKLSLPYYMSKTVIPYTEEQGTKKQQVADMFNNISKTYDFLNHFMSLGIDIIWRKKAINELKKDQPKLILDVATGTGDFAFEPDKAALLGALLPRHIGAQLYRTLLESQAAELAARMNAMESASKNASELIEGLTLKMNKTRQSMITTELNEIVSGSEALGG